MTDRVVAGTGQGPARVLVVEPNMEGHRFNYARILVAECQHRGIPVTLVTTPTGRADYLAKAGATVPDAWELVTDGTRPGAAELARVSEKVGATTVVVPDGDAMALGLARRPRWRSTADLRILIMRAHAQPGRYPQ
ncbi:MAG: hypothetical protein Q4G46_15850, partial [Propionibacteriaceae bacterium]|nr:hypothetical protein [Propionibacteriaceae bacterium]